MPEHLRFIHNCAFRPAQSLDMSGSAYLRAFGVMRLIYIVSRTEGSGSVQAAGKVIICNVRFPTVYHKSVH